MGGADELHDLFKAPPVTWPQFLCRVKEVSDWTAADGCSKSQDGSPVPKHPLLSQFLLGRQWGNRNV